MLGCSVRNMAERLEAVVIQSKNITSKIKAQQNMCFCLFLIKAGFLGCLHAWNRAVR